MAEGKKGPRFSLDEDLIMHGLVERIINEAREGNSHRTILDVALQIKADALNQLDPAEHANYLKACDTIIEFVKGNPNKTISDFFKEHRR